MIINLFFNRNYNLFKSIKLNPKENDASAKTAQPAAKKLKKEQLSSIKPVESAKKETEKLTNVKNSKAKQDVKSISTPVPTKQQTKKQHPALEVNISNKKNQPDLKLANSKAKKSKK